MEVAALEIEGAWVFTPRRHADDRGYFCEWLRGDELLSRLGHPFSVAQANLSVSRRGVVRGVHYADVPPGQAKYVTCAAGAVLDVVVDVRTGSPTFGRWSAVRLDDVRRCGLYLTEGLGHAFVSLTDGATVSYLCSTPYNPAAEHAVSALDPDLGLPWPAELTVSQSPRDEAAPTLARALADGALPSWEACQDYRAQLRLRAAELARSNGR